ncbi:MAG: autotransporter-associated beta strand repeat-containing protein [Kiritimatiellae bacterium]|jgi:fibronectin-binding autotransporter adhesin|nr:autotransporter-associated beta strand repeat-containing protein [Kiritimatiellia bacterium]
MQTKLTNQILRIIPAAVIALSMQTVKAAPISTTGPGGNWGETNTWAGAVVPGSGDDVTILDGASVTVYPNSSAKSLTIDSGGVLKNGTNYTLNLYGNLAANNGTASFYYGVQHQYLNILFQSDSVWTGSADMSSLKTSVTVKSGVTLDISDLTEPMKFLPGFGGGIRLTIEGTLIAGTQVIEGNLSAGGTAPFNLNSGATLQCANVNGIVNGDMGTIYNFTTVNLNPTASYVFNGTASQITTGMLTTNNNLTINNASGVTLSESATINGTLSLENGTLTVAAANTLTLASGTPAIFSADGTALAVIGDVNGAGNLTLNANDITVNVQNTPLIPGDYTLMQCDGTLSKTGTFGVPSITGAGLATGSTASIVVTAGGSGTLVLRITSTLPATTTTLTRTAGTSPSEYGDSLTFHAVIDPAPGDGETISFTADGTLIGTAFTSGGTADITTTTLPYTGGSATDIIAIFADNATYAGSAGSLSGGQQVDQRTLTITGATAASKMYDGTTDATISGGELDNIVSGDIITAATGMFAQSSTGIAINVTVLLSGATAESYTLTQPGLTADIRDTATWIETSGGLWSTAVNWQDNIIGLGESNTVDFSSLDISADATVSLDSERTIGKLIFGDTVTNSAASWTLDNNSSTANTLTLGGTTPTITVNSLGADKDVTISAVMAGFDGVTKEGEGSLTITAENSYSGTTAINEGTLNLDGGDNRILSTGVISFDGSNDSVATLDIGTNSQTLATISFPSTTLTTAMTAKIMGNGGSLIVNGNSSELNLGPKIVAHTIIDLSKLSDFTYDASARILRIGFAPGTSGQTQNPASTVTLAKTNSITVNRLYLGDQTLNGGGGLSTLHLGRVNTLNVNYIRIGANGRSSGLIDFTEEGSTVVIRNTAGTGAVSTWDIGNVSTYDVTTWTADMDFSKGIIDALVNTMTIGTANASSSSNRQGIENASFTLGKGTVGITTLTLGKITNTTGTTGKNKFTGKGTFTINNTNGTLNVNTITMAENTITATGGVRSVAGMFNLEAGTLKATTVQKGVQTGTATATIAFNWTDGIIQNTDTADLDITGIPITLLPGTHTFDISGANTATVDSGSPISGIDCGIIKAGTGTLSLSATNTYSGTTIVTNGVLSLTQDECLSEESDVVISGDGHINLDFTGINIIKSLTVNGIKKSAYNNYGAGNLSPYLTGTGYLRTTDGVQGTMILVR